MTTTSDDILPYYIKIYDTSALTWSSFSIPNSNFEWLSPYTDGQGILASGSYQAFSTSPTLVYTAAGTDLTGAPVHTRFRYKLTIPNTQAAGTYTATVIYLLTETL